MNEVLPISIINVDWSSLLRTARTQLNRSVTVSLDRVNKQPNTPAAFVNILAEAMAPTSDDYAMVLRSAGGLLSHVFASFLFTSDPETLVYILEHSNLTCTRWSNKRTMIVSGTMLGWRTAILDLSTEKSPHDVRDLFNRCMTCFEAIGFAPLWDDFQKKFHVDKTMVLLEKR